MIDIVDKYKKNRLIIRKYNLMNKQVTSVDNKPSIGLDFYINKIAELEKKLEKLEENISTKDNIDYPNYIAYVDTDSFYNFNTFKHKLIFDTFNILYK